MGKLYVVGLGPGGQQYMSEKARAAVEEADVVIGYTTYIALVRDLFPEKEYVQTPMRTERERCMQAIERAGQGQCVALVCSGDAGIYGMAGLVLELLLGGGAGVRQLLNSGFLWVMGMLLLFVAAVTLLVFALGGTDELYCVVDIRGFHVRTALPGANRVKLWMHGKSAALMDTADTNGRVILSEKDLAWKDIARVQLWTDKRLMLLYSPRWWMKLSVPILLAKWNYVRTMVDEKLGKKKAVELPEDWGHQLPPQRVQEKKTRKTAIETDVIPPQTTLPEDEEDYRPLDEVLEELRGK